MHPRPLPDHQHHHTWLGPSRYYRTSPPPWWSQFRLTNLCEAR